MQTSDSSPDKPLPTVRIQSLASGSSGNAYILESGETRLLIDCGIGIRLIQSGLLAWGLQLSDLTATVITHEHSDHVRALDAILRRRIPILSTNGTANALGLPSSVTSCFRCGEMCELGDVLIMPVQTSHDAAEPCGLVISTSGRTIGLFTDMGMVNDGIAGIAETCDLLIFESNHDREMLRLGPYPQFLKARVASNLGHLSNDQAGGFLKEVTAASRGPDEIWLAHLSGTNNTPKVAHSSVSAKVGTGPASPVLTVLPRGKPGPTWNGSNARVRQLQMLPDH